jgi:MFS transporter, PHS family, inorganic phosphate transporter
MQIYALFMFLGIFTTLCIPETKRKTLEELAGEDISAPHGHEARASIPDGNSEEAPKDQVVSETAV